MFRSLVTVLTIIALAFVMSISAGADEPTHADHCVCGGSVTVGNHAHDTTVPQWTAWNGGAITYTDNVAYIYLSADVTIGSTINVTSGNTLNLCLNGYKVIAGDFTGSALFVADGATLNLTDCSNTTGYGNMDATSGLWTAATESGNCNLTGGVITGFTTSQYGGGRRWRHA